MIKSYNMFVYFDDVLMTPHINILNAIKSEEIRTKLVDIIDYSKFEFMDNANLLRLSIQRTEVNILKFIGLSDSFDYDNLYDAIYNNIIDKYSMSPIMNMAGTIATAMSTPMVDKVFIYSKLYSEEIVNKIGAMFTSNPDKVNYIYGDLNTAVFNKNIKLFVLPNTDILKHFMDSGTVGGKEVILPTYGHNYKLINDDLVFKIDLESIKKEDPKMRVETFTPFTLSKDNFTQLYNNIPNDDFLSLG